MSRDGLLRGSYEGFYLYDFWTQLMISMKLYVASDEINYAKIPFKTVPICSSKMHRLLMACLSHVESTSMLPKSLNHKITLIGLKDSINHILKVNQIFDWLLF